MQTPTEVLSPVQPHAMANPVDPHARVAEQRVILHGISWQTYEHLLADCRDTHSAHFAYDRGVLEIMAPSFDHERINRLLHTVFETLAEEMGIDFENAGSTTFRREDLDRGFEPDTCFYMQNVQTVRGKKRRDLAVDPPPDLVIEVDISSPSLDKFPIYAGLGIPEVWRYDSNNVSIFRLANQAYQLVIASVALPGVTNEVLSQFLADSVSSPRPVWARSLREWAQQHVNRKQPADSE